jgi:hypothetical protein
VAIRTALAWGPVQRAIERTRSYFRGPTRELSKLPVLRQQSSAITQNDCGRGEYQHDRLHPSFKWDCINVNVTDIRAPNNKRGKRLETKLQIAKGFNRLSWTDKFGVPPFRTITGDTILYPRLTSSLSLCLGASVVTSIPPSGNSKIPHPRGQDG